LADVLYIQYTVFCNDRKGVDKGREDEEEEG
jgi:hypothetical protein